MPFDNGKNILIIDLFEKKNTNSVNLNKISEPNSVTNQIRHTEIL